jgi:predicted nucleotidyltransferase
MNRPGAPWSEWLANPADNDTDLDCEEPEANSQEVGMPEQLFTDREALAALCRRHHIRRLSLFGSVRTGASRPDSDIDLLVEFEPGAKPGLLTMAKVELELSPLLGGRRVDLRTAGDLSRYFRDEVVRTAEMQYEAR